MNISSLLGMLIAVTVVYFGVFSHSSSKLMFLDSNAILLVLGGTLAAALIAFPFKTLRHLFRFSILGFLFKVRKHDLLVATQILEVHFACQSMQIGPKTQIDSNFHPFLGEGLSLLKRRKFSKDELSEIMQSRIQIVKKIYLNDAKVLQSLAKFPPAFGVLATAAGLISIMNNLTGSPEQMGPGLATALVSTFWGIALSNIVLLPLSDYATKVCFEEIHTREMIADALVMIEGSEASHLVYEKIAGYLPISERPRFREAFRELAVSNGEASTTNARSDIA